MLTASAFESERDLSLADHVLKSIPQFYSALETIRVSKQQNLFGHSVRVAGQAIRVGRSLGFGFKDLCVLTTAALFHDIGKLKIPSNIILKPTQLSDEEYSVIKKHPILSKRMLSAIVPMEDAGLIVQQHHERIDGRGYPFGDAGDQLRLESRILPVVDSYDAMRADRCYRQALSKDKAAAELVKGKGDRYDESVVKRFLCVLEKKKSKLLALLPFRLFHNYPKNHYLLAAMPLHAKAMTIAITISVSVVVGAATSPVIKTAYPNEASRACLQAEDGPAIQEKLASQGQIVEAKNADVASTQVEQEEQQEEKLRNGQLSPDVDSKPEGIDQILTDSKSNSYVTVVQAQPSLSLASAKNTQPVYTNSVSSNRADQTTQESDDAADQVVQSSNDGADQGTQELDNTADQAIQELDNTADQATQESPSSTNNQHSPDDSKSFSKK